MVRAMVTRMESLRVTRWPAGGDWLAMRAVWLTGGGGVMLGGMAGSGGMVGSGGGGV